MKTRSATWSRNAGTGATAVADHRVYDSSGNQVWQTPGVPADCLFGYTGEMLDPATGLQEELNRWYDPKTGRWLSEDPLGLLPDMNPYRYCGNNPTSQLDPFGLSGQVAAGCTDLVPPGAPARRASPATCATPT